MAGLQDEVLSYNSLIFKIVLLSLHLWTSLNTACSSFTSASTMSEAASNAGVVGTWVVPFIVLLATIAVSYITFRMQKAGGDELVQAKKSRPALGEGNGGTVVKLSEEDKDLLRDIGRLRNENANNFAELSQEILKINVQLREQGGDTFILKRVPRERNVTADDY